MNKQQFFGMYIGQRIIISRYGYNSNNERELINKSIEKLIGVVTESLLIDTGSGYSYHLFNDCKLILRPFESITEEEKLKVSEIMHYGNSADFVIKRLYQGLSESNIKYFLKLTEYLISIGIDVFNLKERGWAIYEEDLK